MPSLAFGVRKHSSVQIGGALHVLLAHDPVQGFPYAQPRLLAVNTQPGACLCTCGHRCSCAVQSLLAKGTYHVSPLNVNDGPRKRAMCNLCILVDAQVEKTSAMETPLSRLKLHGHHGHSRS